MIIVVGLALGLVDQAASEVPGMLRFPALIAALILVGQGINLLEQVRQPTVVEEPAEPVTAVVPTVPATAPPVNRGVDPDADEESAGTGTAARLVLILAIWLGLATLMYPTAPLSLTLLSLLAAYLLFARGWKLMTPRR